MTLAKRVRGMKPGRRFRNAGVAVIYLFVFAGLVGAPGGGGGDGPDTGNSMPNVTPTRTSDTTRAVESTSAPDPTPTAITDGQSYSFDGQGKAATDWFAIEGELVTVDLLHTGCRNFIVYLVNAETGGEDLLVTVVGDFDGRVATNAPTGEYIPEVDADGGWEATVEQPRYSVAEVSDLPATTDNGDIALLGPYRFEGVTRVSMTPRRKGTSSCG